MNKNIAGLLGAAAVLTMLAGCTAWSVSWRTGSWAGPDLPKLAGFSWRSCTIRETSLKRADRWWEW